MKSRFTRVLGWSADAQTECDVSGTPPYSFTPKNCLSVGTPVEATRVAVYFIPLKNKNAPLNLGAFLDYTKNHSFFFFVLLSFGADSAFFSLPFFSFLSLFGDFSSLSFLRDSFPEGERLSVA